MDSLYIEGVAAFLHISRGHVVVNGSLDLAYTTSTSKTGDNGVRVEGNVEHAHVKSSDPSVADADAAAALSTSTVIFDYDNNAAQASEDVYHHTGLNPDDPKSTEAGWDPLTDGIEEVKEDFASKHLEDLNIVQSLALDNELMNRVAGEPYSKERGSVKTLNLFGEDDYKQFISDRDGCRFKASMDESGDVYALTAQDSDGLYDVAFFAKDPITTGEYLSYDEEDWDWISIFNNFYWDLSDEWCTVGDYNSLEEKSGDDFCYVHFEEYDEYDDDGELDPDSESYLSLPFSREEYDGLYENNAFDDDCFSFLTTIDLSNFDSSKMTSFNWLFQCDYALKTIKNIDKLSKATNVDRVSSMFNYCYSLVNVDLSSLDWSNVTNYTSGMFTADRTAKAEELWDNGSGKYEYESYDDAYGDAFDLMEYKGTYHLAYECPSLRSITLPKGLKYLSSNSFNQDKGTLQRIDVVLSDTELLVVSEDAFAFNGQTEIAVEYPGTSSEWGVVQKGKMHGGTISVKCTDGVVDYEQSPSA